MMHGPWGRTCSCLTSKGTDDSSKSVCLFPLPVTCSACNLSGPSGQLKKASITVSTINDKISVLTVLDLLKDYALRDVPQYEFQQICQWDSIYRRPPGYVDLNHISLNLGYMDPNTQLTVQTLGPDNFRELPLLAMIYAYDLDLNAYYKSCGDGSTSTCRFRAVPIQLSPWTFPALCLDFPSCAKPPSTRNPTPTSSMGRTPPQLVCKSWIGG